MTAAVAATRRHLDPVLPSMEVLRRARQQPDLQALSRASSNLDGAPEADREVLHAARGSRRTGRFAGIYLNREPSDGLEPSTPSLPWRLTYSAPGRRRRASRLALVDLCAFAALLDLCPETPRKSLRTPVPVPKTCPQDAVWLGSQISPVVVMLAGGSQGVRVRFTLSEVGVTSGAASAGSGSCRGSRRRGTRRRRGSTSSSLRRARVNG